MLANLIAALLSFLTMAAPPAPLHPLLPQPLIINEQVWILEYPARIPGYFGVTSCPLHKIFVSHQPCSEWRDTVLHEHFHAVTHCHYTMRMTHPAIAYLSNAVDDFLLYNSPSLRCPAR